MSIHQTHETQHVRYINKNMPVVAFRARLVQQLLCQKEGNEIMFKLKHDTDTYI